MNSILGGNLEQIIRFNEADRNRDAVIRVYDDAGKVIETPDQAGDFKEW